MKGGAFLRNAAQNVLRRVRGSLEDRIRLVRPSDAQGVAAVTKALYDSIKVDAANPRTKRNYHEEVLAAMETSNYQIANFILTHWDYKRTGLTADGHLLRFLNSAEYATGRGFELLDHLLRLRQLYSVNGARDGGTVFENYPDFLRVLDHPGALDALLEPHYMRDAAAVFAGASWDTPEGRPLAAVAFLARKALDVKTTQAMCKWYFRKLKEFGPNAPVAPESQRRSRKEAPPPSTVADCVFDDLEYLVQSIYATLGKPAHAALGVAQKELTPLICHAVQSRPHFRLRVDHMLQGIGRTTADAICTVDPPAAAEVLAPPAAVVVHAPPAAVEVLAPSAAASAAAAKQPRRRRAAAAAAAATSKRSRRRVAAAAPATSKRPRRRVAAAAARRVKKV